MKKNRSFRNRPPQSPRLDPVGGLSTGGLKKGDKITVQIERMAVGGRGVARHEGLVIFCSDTAPGDEAEVEVTLKKKSFAEARLIKVIKASPHRVEPPCPVAAVCGGCNWQHIEYPEQLRQKRSFLIEALNRFSGFEVSETEVGATVASPNDFRYRNRVQFHHGNGRFGFFKRASHEIVDIHDCPITEEVITREIPRLRQELASSQPGRTEVYVAESGRAHVRNEAGSSGDSSDAPFSQVNTGQNSNLIEHVGKLCRELQGSFKPDLVLDLYCGNGNFTLPLAKEFSQAKVIGVELSEKNVELARARAQAESFEKPIEFLASDVGAYLQRQPPLTAEHLIVLDPPRTGCGPEVTRQLASLGAETIIYVSCHPVTLARDLKPLAENGFVLTSIVAFDMFPQTDHVESVVLLRRTRS